MKRIYNTCDICEDPADLLILKRLHTENLKMLREKNAPKPIIDLTESVLTKIKFRLMIQHKHVEAYLNTYYR